MFTTNVPKFQRCFSQKVIVLSGMTGIGKTSFTQQLKKEVNGEIICADSSQIYKGLKVLTNKERMEDGKYAHLTAKWNHQDKVTSARYALECRQKIKEIFQRGKTPILEGGSGFYIQSVFNRKLLTPKPNFEQAKLEAERILEKNNYDYKVLQKYDPENYLCTNPQFSKYKLVNSLAIVLSFNPHDGTESPSQPPLSELIKEAEDDPDNIYFSQIPKRCFYLYNTDKFLVNEALDYRCENMILKNNLFQEVLNYCHQVRQFLEHHCQISFTNPSEATSALSYQESEFKDILSLYDPLKESSISQIKEMYPVTHSIGFFQVLKYFHRLNSLEAIDGEVIKEFKAFLREFKTANHQYVKRQNTWFKSSNRDPPFYKIEKLPNENTGVMEQILPLITCSEDEYLSKLAQNFKEPDFPQEPPTQNSSDDFENFMNAQKTLKDSKQLKQKMYEPKSKILRNEYKLSRAMYLSQKAAQRYKEMTGNCY
ncbi:unnamed protein product [Moneuplotes crassus]|uniref:tRNA dimethylallyltransferase n=1 Tax=Euplotes crassus TaxID=5936 RepID=A0AAD1UBA5_EUPCR|nr:unnamed protein product [Moneuplotes crassus]